MARTRGARSLSDLDPTFTRMGSATQKAAAAAVRKSTAKLSVVVDKWGRSHHIKGRSGRNVQLTSKMDVRGWRNYSKDAVVWTGAVRGIPEGFWVIVEYGSPRHLITSRGERVTRTGRKVSGKYSASKRLRLFGEGHTFSDLKPLSAQRRGGSFGPYQWVMHPGHGPQGRPWENAMREGAPMVAEEMALTQQRELVRAFIEAI